ncbi:phosducin-like protein [Sitodiplosis mosellana]|uniref:phosducin-like protein n=1 Tax=Sitodiplosis mosellana TaxID=263140 RepID=UPI0024445B8B|nr:phosducin-like protein [Sitodiplosis mosellana]
MATLEDKILGDDKRENYCSSDEGEADDFESADGSPIGAQSAAACEPSNQTYFTRETVDKWSGSSTNTGPKGVIKDWQRFKQLENEKNVGKETEKLSLMKKLCITAKTVAEDGRQAEQDELDTELAELMNDDSILLQFQQQRMREMLERCGKQQKIFGTVFSLANGDEFLNAIDNEDKSVPVIVHIYENKLLACKTMNRCLDELAQNYKSVKFCKIFGSVAGMSANFKIGGIPALLVYKSGNLIGNFVRLSDELGGDEFFASDVESFLIEHAMLPDNSHVPIIVSKTINGNDDDD